MKPVAHNAEPLIHGDVPMHAEVLHAALEEFTSPPGGAGFSLRSDCDEARSSRMLETTQAGLRLGGKPAYSQACLHVDQARSKAGSPAGLPAPHGSKN